MGSGWACRELCCILHDTPSRELPFFHCPALVNYVRTLIVITGAAAAVGAAAVDTRWPPWSSRRRRL